MGIIKGKKLMLFIKKNNQFVSVGYATNHTLSTSASTINVSHKDLEDAGSGKWDDQNIDTLSWTITTENFYADDASGISFSDLFGYYTAGTELDVKFAVAATSSTGVPSTGWLAPTAQGSYVMSGKVVITSIDMNAPVDDNASFSMTFTGKGALSAETLS
jgi:predicted secreted protein